MVRRVGETKMDMSSFENKHISWLSQTRADKY